MSASTGDAAKIVDGGRGASLPPLPSRYRIVREIGRGAQGAVYLADDGVLGTEVALKVLAPSVAGDADVLERLRREVVLTRRVVHPGVCRVHDLTTSPEATFIVMDFVDGTSLQTLFSAGPLPVTEALRIVRAACDAVAAVHAVGVVHRDLKPANILVGDDGQVVVVDFGVATAHDLAPLTELGAVVGTRAFIPPEVWLGAPATALADVFALGVVLYQALTAAQPYEALAAGAGIARTDGDARASADGAVDSLHAAVPPSARRPELPSWLDDVVLRAIAPQPGARFPSMRAFAAALAGPPRAPAAAPPKDVLDDATVLVARRAPPPPARAGRGVGVAIAVVTAGVVAVAGALVVRSGVLAGEPPPAPAVASPATDEPRADGALPAAGPGAGSGSTSPSSSAAPVAGTAVAATEPTSDAEERAPVAAAPAKTRGLDTRRAAALKDVQRERARRGVLPKDLPAVDDALVALARAKSVADVEAARADALAALSAFRPDARFLDRKLQRLNAAFGVETDEAVRTRMRAQLSKASSLIAARKYVEANAALNAAQR